MQLPMICDSCALRFDGNTCAAFPDKIPLDLLRAELHDTPRPGQGNDLVYTEDPSRSQQKQDFLDFREALGDKAA